MEINKDGEETNVGVDSFNINRHGVSFDPTRVREATDLTKFKSNDDLINQAEKLYAGAINKIKNRYEEDKKLGLDVNSLESVKSFNIDYTPAGDTVLVKFIYEKEEVGSIILPDQTTGSLKAVVFVPGLLVNTLEKGDVVVLKGKDIKDPIPPFVDRVFKGIEFKEVVYQAIAGIFKNRAELLKRFDTQ